MDAASDMRESAVDLEIPETRHEERTRHDLVIVEPPKHPKTGCLRKVITHFCSYLGLLCIVICYSVLGGLMFQEIEANYYETETLFYGYHMKQVRGLYVKQLWNIRKHVENETRWDNEVEAITKKFQDQIYNIIRDGGWQQEADRDKAVVKPWSTVQSILFSVALITTLGYGNITPKTKEGKFATIVYSVIGIPLTFLFLSNMGRIMAVAFRAGYSKAVYRLKKAKRRLTRSSCPVEPKLVRIPVFLSFSVILLYIVLGAMVFSYSEDDWNFLSAAYFCLITVSTIGLGDYVFGESIDQNDSGYKLLFTCVYLVFGLVIVIMTFDLIVDEVKAKLKSLGRKMGVIY